MQSHYGLSDEAYSNLIASGVTFADMFKAVKFFDPIGSGLELTKVNLMYYVDAKGDFNDPPRLPHKKIASAFFESLPIKDKIEIAEYIDYLENGEDE